MDASPCYNYQGPLRERCNVERKGPGERGWIASCVFHSFLALLACADTWTKLNEFEINCKAEEGYDKKLKDIGARLKEADKKLIEMGIKLNESKAIDTMEIVNMLSNLKDIRSELKDLKKDLDHNKADIKRRKNDHISGAVFGIVNVIRTCLDYGLATTAGVGTGWLVAAGVFNAAATAGHGVAAVWCQEDLNMIGQRLVTVKAYEEKVEKIVKRIEPLRQQLRAMNNAPGTPAVATFSPVA
ncbi:uncharacterized protein [Branchiostoma lanceolatum]|uniref:uncharacterized protein n=1 Tax=Branchiostoma lanceolatum TaxID=7740 RepID=UPI0034571A5C